MPASCLVLLKPVVSHCNLIRKCGSGKKLRDERVGMESDGSD
jgi:hypothetical protein